MSGSGPECPPQVNHRCWSTVALLFDVTCWQSGTGAAFVPSAPGPHKYPSRRSLRSSLQGLGFGNRGWPCRWGFVVGFCGWDLRLGFAVGICVLLLGFAFCGWALRLGFAVGLCRWDLPLGFAFCCWVLRFAVGLCGWAFRLGFSVGICGWDLRLGFAVGFAVCSLVLRFAVGLCGWVLQLGWLLGLVDGLRGCAWGLCVGVGLLLVGLGVGPPGGAVVVGFGGGHWVPCASASVRLFDLRSLDHSTIIYETADYAPVLRLTWNKQVSARARACGVCDLGGLGMHRPCPRGAGGLSDPDPAMD